MKLKKWEPSRSTAVGLLIVLTIAFVGVINANAQNTSVTLLNRTAQNLKICFYNTRDAVRLIAFKCEKVPARGSERTSINSIRYQIRVFRDGLIDKELYRQGEINNASTISMGSARATITTRPSITNPMEYVLKVCNSTSRDPIFFTLGFEANSKMHLEGWWSLRMGQCRDFPVSNMMWENWRILYGTVPQTFFYAKTYGSNPLVWNGNDSDKLACINRNKAFRYVAALSSPLYVGNVHCSESRNLMEVRMRSIEPPRANQEYYRLTF
jgi:uncharacterized membrane protein